MEKSFACLDAADRISHDGLDDDEGNKFDGAISRDELIMQARLWEETALE